MQHPALMTEVSPLTLTLPLRFATGTLVSPRGEGTDRTPPLPTGETMVPERSRGRSGVRGETLPTRYSTHEACPHG